MEIIALLIVIAMCVCSYGGEICSWFDTSRWESPNTPSMDACIINVKPEKVKYLKNRAKYKTTVKFSDGFVFVTHKTERKDKFMRYEISLNYKYVCELAKVSHEEAVSKRLK